MRAAFDEFGFVAIGRSVVTADTASRNAEVAKGIADAAVGQLVTTCP